MSVCSRARTSQEGIFSLECELIVLREKLLKYDARRREYDVVVIGEEPHLAYNRVGLTSFFQHREVESLYLNPKDWVSRFSANEI